MKVQTHPLKILLTLKIHTFGLYWIFLIWFQYNVRFRYPSGPTAVPPGQFHESPTEQYWSGLPNEQDTSGGRIHPNANPYSQNCNINNNLNSSDDYDGTILASDWGWS